MTSRLLSLPRHVKQLTVISLDVVLSVVATWTAFSLRLDTPNWPSGDQWKAYGVAVLLAIPVFGRFGLYRAIFRYTGLAAMTSTTKAVAVYGAMFFAVLVTFQWPMVPRSLGVMQPLLFLLLVAASRALARFWLLDHVGRQAQAAAGQLLVYGAGAAGVQTANGLNAAQFKLVGFVDDDPSKVGRSINRVSVIAPSEVPAAVARLGVTDILLAMPSASRQRRNEIIERLRPLPVHVRTLPGLADLASGRVSVQDFQELDIEDLLGRDPVAPDPALLARHIAGKTVLVTGAGGSIGSELCRQILHQRPARLLLVDHSEFNLYSIHQELEESAAQATLPMVPVQLVPLLANVTREDRMADIFRAFRPDTVYHAAAYKHVPLVEQNPSEGLLNNVFGTLVTAQAAQAHGTTRFVLVSTDKAVRPTNIMGASKRVAELVLQALACESGGATSFAMVRFGNVLGSSGSVVPLFRRQLAGGGPLTVTHFEVTRYFMTIPEAAQLVLQAGSMAQGGEVFVLDMGEPVRILDLARRMVKLSGLRVRDEATPDGDIEIAITGLRPGEKLYEELLIGDNPEPTPHPRIMKAHESLLPWATLDAELGRLRAVIAGNDIDATRDILARLVSGFQPDPKVVDHMAMRHNPQIPLPR